MEGGLHVADYSGVGHAIWYGGRHGSTRKGSTRRKARGALAPATLSRSNRTNSAQLSHSNGSCGPQMELILFNLIISTELVLFDLSHLSGTSSASQTNQAINFWIWELQRTIDQHTGILCTWGLDENYQDIDLYQV